MSNTQLQPAAKVCLLQSPVEDLMTERHREARGQGGHSRCMARSLGITVGLLGGLDPLLFRLLRLSRLGDACTVILCWKSGQREKGEELRVHGLKLFSQPRLQHTAIPSKHGQTVRMKHSSKSVPQFLTDLPFRVQVNNDLASALGAVETHSPTHSQRNEIY